MTEHKDEAMTLEQAFQVLDDEIAALPTMASMIRLGANDCDESDAVARLKAARNTLDAAIAARDDRITASAQEMDRNNRIRQRLAWLKHGLAVCLPEFTADIEAALAKENDVNDKGRPSAPSIV